MTQSDIFSHAQKALLAMQKAVLEVLRKHKQLGEPIYVSRNGHLQKIPATKISLPRHFPKLKRK